MFSTSRRRRCSCPGDRVPAKGGTGRRNGSTRCVYDFSTQVLHPVARAKTNETHLVGKGSVGSATGAAGSAGSATGAAGSAEAGWVAEAMEHLEDNTSP